METTEITAGRLHLRPWVPLDLDDVYDACQDPEIQRWTSVPSPYTREDARLFVEETSPQGWADGTAAGFAVLDATTGGLLASVSLFAISSRRRSAEIGWWAAPAARRQGVTSEAVATVARWGFGPLDLHRVHCLVEVGNVASQRTALRAGFTHEGVARGALPLSPTEVADAWQAALLATD